MSRRAAFLSTLTSVTIAVAVTAMAFILIGDDIPTDEIQISTASVTMSERSTGLSSNSPAEEILTTSIVQNELSASSVPIVSQPPQLTQIDASETTVAPPQSPVDWAAIYVQVVPALVTVATDEGAGSGFFVSEDGHLITNFHVVSGAEEIQIYSHDGMRLDAELIAKDVGNDLALLKVDPGDMEITVPTFGSVDDLRVGDPVAALGAPFNLPNSLTVGIVSGLDRPRRNGAGTTESLRSTIQTDAALNPGNSGGMLIDGYGRLVGIPTQVETGGTGGIGFAVSVDALLLALPTMLAGEDAERGHLGVRLDLANGTLEISAVACDSAADDANLRVGDQLLAVNGESLDSFDTLSDILSSTSPGEEITITVQRGINQLTLNATVGSWPSQPAYLGCG